MSHTFTLNGKEYHLWRPIGSYLEFCFIGGAVGSIVGGVLAFSLTAAAPPILIYAAARRLLEFSTLSTNPVISAAICPLLRLGQILLKPLETS